MSPKSIETVRNTSVQERQSKSVGRLLTVVRRSAVGHNFAQYAQQMGMSPLEYSNWESGRNGLPTPSHFETWADKNGWDNETATEFYLAAGNKLPEDRVSEINRKWDLAVYNSKFNGGTHPMVGAMNELFDYSAKQNTFLTKLHVLGAVARSLLRK
jgi:transcriptional regulator with XRE-family HTH domain